MEICFWVADTTSRLLRCVWLGTDWTLIFCLGKMLAVELSLYFQVKFFMFLISIFTITCGNFVVDGTCRCDKGIRAPRSIKPSSSRVCNKHAVGHPNIYQIVILIRHSNYFSDSYIFNSRIIGYLSIWI